jgi:nitroreductase
METLNAIAERHSSRSYQDLEVPRDLLEKIVDAGRLAATARNEQPWELIVVTDAAMRLLIADVTEYGKHIAEAPACVAVFCRDTKYYLEDGSAATQNMLVAAASLGVQSCWVAGDKKSYVKDLSRLLGVPVGFRLVSLVALGYEKTAPPRVPKRALDQVLHWDTFTPMRRPT